MKKISIVLLPLLFIVGCSTQPNSSQLPVNKYPNTPEVTVPTSEIKVEENDGFDFGDILKFFADLFTK